MARLNIYVPDELHELAAGWRGTKNLSAICARALREELEATDAFRSPGELMSHLRGANELERGLIEKFGLVEAAVCESPADKSHLRASLGEAAAAYLDRNLTDGATLGFAGGRQTWCIVRSLHPRRLRLSIAAVGVAPNDPRVLHAHPNTLVTLLSLLYAPRSEAHLIGYPGFGDLWKRSGNPKNLEPQFFVVASCASFSATGPFASLLGPDVVETLVREGVCGDFAGVFLCPDGRPVAPANDQASSFSPEQLTQLSERPDGRVLLAAGGTEKLAMIRLTLGARLCNVLVTDASTARQLLTEERSRDV